MPDKDNQRPRRFNDVEMITARDRQMFARYMEPPPSWEPVGDKDVPGYIRYSPRWQNLEALRFEHDKAIRNRDTGRRAREVAEAINRLGQVKQAGDLATKRRLPINLPGVLARGLGGGIMAGAWLAEEVGEREEAYNGRKAAAIDAQIQKLQRR